MTKRAVTLPDHLVFSFESQRQQYAASGPAGLSYERHTIDTIGPHAIVDCLLWRDEDGTLLGVGNYYPNGIPPYEHAGNINLYVDPVRRREGIATRLLTEADRRWRIDLDAQRYTRAGLVLVIAYEQRRH